MLKHWPHVTDSVLEVGGRRLRVLRADSRHPGGGEPQLLVHGLGGSSVGWVPIIEGLTAHGPVVAVDLPGFGRTPVGDHPLTVEGYADLVVELVATLGWERLTLHGNSMGGLIGTLVAADHPGLVSRLVLVSPGFPPRTPLGLLVPARATLDGMLPIAASSVHALVLGAVNLAGPELDQKRNRAMLRLIFSEPDDVDPRLMSLMAEDYASGLEAADRRRAMVTATRSIARLWTDPRRTWRAIQSVTAPTLVLGGTQDALVPAKVLRQVLKARPDWEGHVLDERRHALMLEDPDAYLRLLDRWVVGTTVSRAG
jgi:pimeloyl-ACP methyl ester carboxylesterase